tara:strand:- start:514 stop:1005 length:492 start_codon:yes stop_codon:yes gene_type:complete
MTGKIKLNATSGGGSISLNAPSSAGGDTDLLDTSGNMSITGNLSVDNDLKIDSGFGSTSTVYGCRAWIQLDQSGSQSITGSGGVSSISDSGTGATTINFTTAMPDDNYAIVGGAQQSSSSGVNYGFSLCIQSYNTTNAQFIYRPSASSDTKEDSSKVSIAFFR